jgi:histidinol-phosphatase (PHP family)
MRLTDQHVHTGHSPDGSGALSDHYSIARERSIEIIAFTDHLDYEYYGGHDENCKRLEAIDESIQALDISDGCHPVFGIELSYQEEYTHKVINDLATAKKLDFIIGSLHVINEIGFSGGSSVKKYFDTFGKRGFSVYMDALAGFVENGIYDVIGHFDIVKRYSKLHGYTYNSSEYTSIIRDILKVIIAKGKSIEINGSGIHQPAQEPFPDFRTVEMFFELGGKWLTVGSDSHNPKSVGRSCDYLTEKLLEMGVTKLATFEKRNPQLVDID